MAITTTKDNCRGFALRPSESDTGPTTTALNGIPLGFGLIVAGLLPLGDRGFELKWETSFIRPGGSSPGSGPTGERRF